MARVRSRPIPSRGAAACAAAIAALVLVIEARGDGGAVRLAAVAEPFAITVFSPEPLVAGRNDLSVLVQTTGGEAVLDAVVDLVLEPPDGAEPLRVRATRSAATNKLLQAALVDLPEAGTWNLAVEVRRDGATARIRGALAVGAAPPRAAALWPLFALPAAAVALFALGQWLSARRAARPLQKPKRSL